MKGIEALNDFLKSEGALPQGQPSIPADEANGAKLAGKGATSGSGDSDAGPAIGAPGVSEEKLSEDDENVNAQLHDKAPQELAKGQRFHTRHELEQTVARQKAIKIQQLRKSAEAEAVVVEEEETVQKSEAVVEKSSAWSQGEDARFNYTNQSDLAVERLMKSSDFYHGDSPAIPAVRRQDRVHQASGDVVVIQKSSNAPGLRRANRDEDVVILNRKAE
jgi:hypothetical protein